MLNEDKLLVFQLFPKFLPFSHRYLTLVLENIGRLEKNTSGKKGGEEDGKMGAE